MTYIYEYDIAAFFVCGIILIMQAIRHGYPTKTRRLFNILTVITMICSLSDALTAFSIFYPSVEPLWLNHLLQIIYYLSQTMLAPVFSIFLLSIADGKNMSKKHLFVICAFSFYAAVIVLLSPFFGLAYRLDSDGNYSHGLLFYTLYFGSMFLLLSDIPSLLKNRDNMLRFQRITAYVYIFTPLAALAVQAFYPHHLIFCLVASLTLLMNYLSLENPGDYIAPNTECLNRKALNAYTDDHYFSEIHFSVIAFSIDSQGLFDNPDDRRLLGLFLNPLIKGLQERFGYNNVFLLTQNQFAVTIDRKAKHPDGRDSITYIRDLVNSILEKTIGSKNLPVNFLIVKYPENCIDKNSLSMTLETFFNKHLASAAPGSVTNADDKAMVDRLREKQMVEVFRNVLRTRSFFFYFHPILDLRTQTFRSAEILLRFNDSILGSISPADYIHIAEHNGLINELGLMMFDEVCSFLKRRKNELYGVDYIEFNLSIPHPLTEHIAGDYIAIMDRYGLPHDFFNFEVTEECAALVDRDMLKENLEEFSKAGVSLSMDDFGTGYSNIMNLLDLPIDLVKIDKSLLWKSMDHNEADIMLRENVSTIHRIGKSVLVEGVETREMADKIIDLKCDYIQGFLYSSPISPNAYLSFLAEHNLPLNQ